MFNAGDHIKTKIDSVFHHGVYVSNDEVIHFCSNEQFSILSNDLEVKATTIAQFANGNRIEKVECKNRFNSQKSINIARAKIGNSDYDIIFNNCEHFVNSCITGKKESYEMNSLKEKELNIRRNSGVNGAIDKIYRLIQPEI